MGEIFDLTDHLGKTIERWTSQYFDVREYWHITFTDGTMLHVMSDSDYSDIRTSMEIITDEEARELLAEYDEEDE